jgi:hypothetical protein
MGRTAFITGKPGDDIQAKILRENRWGGQRGIYRRQGSKRRGRARGSGKIQTSESCAACVDFERWEYRIMAGQNHDAERSDVPREINDGILLAGQCFPT